MHLNTEQLAELKQGISSYLAGHKSRTVATLARRAGVGQSTIRRMQNGAAVNPDFETLIAILKVIYPAEQAVGFISTIAPELSDHIASIYGGTPPPEPTDVALNRLLENEGYYVIFQLASMARGTTRETLSRVLGKKAEADLEHLIKQGFVSEAHGVIRSRVDNFAITDIRTALATVMHLVKRFDTTLTGTNASALATIAGSVSQQGLTEMRDEIERAVRTIEGIRQRNPGTIPAYTNIMMNLLDSDAYHRSDQASGKASRHSAARSGAQREPSAPTTQHPSKTAPDLGERPS